MAKTCKTWVRNQLELNADYDGKNQEVRLWNNKVCDWLFTNEKVV